MLEQFLDSPFATSQVQNTLTRGLTSHNPMNALVPMVIEQSARGERSLISTLAYCVSVWCFLQDR